MSMKKTINGRKIKSREEKFIRLVPRQVTEERDRKNFIAQMNAARTYNNRSAEIRAKQEMSAASKAKAEARVAELQQALEGLVGGELFNAILASFRSDGVEATMKKKEFKTELDKLKKNSDEFYALTHDEMKAIAKEITFYDDFLTALAHEFTPFILYLPAACFKHVPYGALPLNSLDKDELAALQQRLEKTDVFSNEVFKNKYLRYFPSHIKEMTNIDDIAYTLRLDPAGFAKLDAKSEVRASLWQNPRILDRIIKRAPEVLIYLTPEELEYYAEKCATGVGLAIKDCPHVLEHLPKNFFDRHSPKYVFSNQKKHELKTLLAPYFDKFPTLAVYFDSKFIRPTGPKPKRQTTITFPIDI